MEKEEHLINNRYLIRETLGQGGMGIVFLVDDTLKSNMKFAVKMISNKMISNARLVSIENFKNEYEIMTRLKHPNLTQVYDFGICGENYFIVMEYLDGLLLKECKPDKEKILDIIVQISRALEYIHSRNIIYRDLKPANIMIVDKMVKLLDFGLSSYQEKKERKLRGTLMYLSPDIVLKNIDISSDIFSLGLVFYELLTGDRFYNVKKGRVKDLISLLEDNEAFVLFQKERLSLIKDDNYRNIIYKMTAFNSQGRYESCSEIITDINRYFGTTYEFETHETSQSYVLGSPFSNRQAELSFLKESVFDKAPVFSIFSGNFGIGKTRLFSEFKKYCRLNNILFFESNCMEKEIRQYYSIGEIILQMMTFSPDELVFKFGTYLKMILPEVDRLSGFTVFEEDPVIMRDIRTDNITDFIISFSNFINREIIIYFNDIQWIDDASVEILTALKNRINAAKDFENHFRFFANLNENKLLEKSRIKEFLNSDDIEFQKIRPLDKDSINDYIRNVFGSKFLDRSIMLAEDHIVKMTGGNPFLLGELLKLYLSKGIIKKHGRYWTLTVDLNKDLSPVNFSEIIVPGIKKLLINDEKREVLQLLSLLRTDIPFFTIKEIFMKRKDIAGILLELERSEIITGNNIDGRIFYTFNSILVKELIRESIKDKEQLSLFIAQKLESIYGERSDDYTAEIAYQYEQGNDKENAFRLYKQSGITAQKLYLNEKAIEYFDKALSLISESERPNIILKKAECLVIIGQLDKAQKILEDIYRKILDNKLKCRTNNAIGEILMTKGLMQNAKDRFDESYKMAMQDEELKKEVMINIGLYHFNRSEYDLALLYFNKYRKICEKLSDQKGYALIINNIANVYFMQSEYHKALKYYREFRDISQKTGDKKYYAGAIGNMGNVYKNLGKYGEAKKCFNLHKRVSEEIGYKRGIATSTGNLGNVYSKEADFEKAIFCYELQKKISEEIGDIKGTRMAIGNLGAVYLDTGDIEKALEYFEDHRVISESIDDKRGVSIAIYNKGIAYSKIKRFDMALECFGTYKNISAEIGDKQGVGMAMCNMGAMYIETGNYEKALSCFNTFRQISEEIGYRSGVGIATGNIGGIYYYKGDFEKAIEYYDKHLQIAQAIGDNCEIGEVLSNIGECYLQKMDYDMALEYFDKAIDLYDTLKIEDGHLIDSIKGKSEILLKKNDLSGSYKLIERALNISQRVKDRESVFNARLQGLRLKAKIKNIDIKGALLCLLEKDPFDEEKAAIYYELFMFTKNEEYRKKAMQSLNLCKGKIPLFLYNRRLKELLKP